jgi:hypothetical protein
MHGKKAIPVGGKLEVTAISFEPGGAMAGAPARAACAQDETREHDDGPWRGGNVRGESAVFRVKTH